MNTLATSVNILFKPITEEELLQAFVLMQQLREDITLEDFLFVHSKAKQCNQYTLIGAYDEEELVALMGYRILYDYVHGKHLYIDDLVVSYKHRGQGFGAQMLTYAEANAAKLLCNGVRLSTGTSNTEGIRFYEREGWQLKAYTYKKGF